MAKIVSITLRKNDGDWTFGVVRDDNYTELIEEEVGEIENEIKRLVEFANSIKTEEQKLIEKVEKDKEELFKILTKKTTLDERIDIATILPRWESDIEYKIGDERTYNEILYISKKDHTSSYETIPTIAKEFWKKALKEKDIPEDYNHEKKYKINEKCTFNRRIYSSLVEQEGKSPFESPATWEDEGEI